ncbi:MAG: hypothetical protein WCG48_03190 [Candidatus Berkelbacteria bacterium]
MRDNKYLEAKLQEILATKFADKPLANPISIEFGRKAATRLGSIRKDGRTSRIIITGHFADEKIPANLIDCTIAHELCHYFQGFCSDHEQISAHPHQGKIVDRELIKRGYGDDLIFQKKWLKEHWPSIAAPTRKIRRRHPTTLAGVIKSILWG